MLSVVIATFNAEEVLARTLAPLVAGVADGLVKDCVVADESSTDETRAMAEAAGCALVTASRFGGWRAGAAAAKGEWLLLLPADLVLARGWIEAARAFIETGGAAATFRYTREGESALAALFAPPARGGLLIARARAEALGGLGEGVGAYAAFARGVGRITALGVRAHAQAVLAKASPERP